MPVYEFDESEENRSILTLYTASAPLVRSPVIPLEYSSFESDLFYEASRLLQLMKVPLAWEARMSALARLEDGNDRRYKHLHLYNFIALALVRKAQGDVCSVAVYQSNTAVELYYAKKTHRGANAADEFRKDLEHAKQLKEIVRAVAKSKITENAFRSEFFAAVFENCKEKLSRRIASLLQATTGPSANSRKPSVIDEMECIATSAVLPVIPSTEADIQAIKFSKRENLPEAVMHVLFTLVSKINSISQYYDQTEDKLKLNLSFCTATQILRISALAWIAGQSSIVNTMVRRTRSPGIAKLVSCLRKLGAYYRGLELLYRAIMDSKLNAKYQALLFKRIPSPEPETPSLCPEWYKAMDIIYHRERSRGMLVTPTEIVTAFPQYQQCKYR